MTPTLSIVIPTYHMPTEIGENLENLLNIPDEDIEFVVVDNDVLSDDTLNRLKIIKDARFHYYRNESNLGRTKNIVRAIEMAKSNFVCILSTDDRLNTSYIPEIKKELKSEMAVMLGNVITSLGKYEIKMKESTYESGYESYMNLPFLGNLIPMVINKKYIDIEDLNRVNNEVYMQMRIALLACQKGSLVTKGGVIGYVQDASTYDIDYVRKCDIPTQNIFSLKSGSIYYHPLSRAEQVIEYLKIIEKTYMNTFELRTVSVLWLERFLRFSLEYMVVNSDKYFLITHGRYEYLNMNQILNIFYRTCYTYFESKKDDYCMLGSLDDMFYDYSRMLKESKKMYFDMCRKEVYLFGASSFGRKVLYVLEKMGIEVQGFIDNSKNKQGSSFENYPVYSPQSIDYNESIILITSTYRREIMQQLEKNGKSVNAYIIDESLLFFFNVWCADIAEENAQGYNLLR